MQCSLARGPLAVVSSTYISEPCACFVVCHSSAGAEQLAGWHAAAVGHSGGRFAADMDHWAAHRVNGALPQQRLTKHNTKHTKERLLLRFAAGLLAAIAARIDW